MTEKKWAVFRADAFPDDTIEDEQDIIRFPGRNLAEALMEILAARGCAKIEPPSEEGEHGWHVRFTSDGRPFLCQVSRIEPETLLLFDRNFGAPGRFEKGPAPHAVFLEKIQAALAQDARFQELTWYTQREMDTVDWHLPLAETEGDPNP